MFSSHERFLSISDGQSLLCYSFLLLHVSVELKVLITVELCHHSCQFDSKLCVTLDSNPLRKNLFNDDLVTNVVLMIFSFVIFYSTRQFEVPDLVKMCS